MFMEREWYKVSAEEAIKQLGSSRNGLTLEEVEKRQRIYKKNIIYEEYKINAFKILLDQFKSFFVLLLLVAAAISLFIGEVIDFYLILAFIIIITLIGFVQEYKAETIVKQLKKMTLPKTKVIRNGQHMEISSAELVPGDIIVLTAGDKITADCRIIEAHELEVDESLITGESTPVKKTSERIDRDEEIADRVNMLYSGSVVTHGRCTALVTETGSRTEIGKIARLVGQQEEQSPLSREIDKLGKQLTFILLIACLFIFFVVLSEGADAKHAFLGVLALAVSVVPESLPIIITVSLAVGSNVMAKKKVLVRKFIAIESLASIDVICSDKTGTLTRNELTVKEIYTNRAIEVTGSGYVPEGKFLIGKKEIDAKKDERLMMLLKAGVVCNSSMLKNSTGNYWVLGSPLEGALLVLAKKAGLEFEREEERIAFEIPFDSKRKMMTVGYRERGVVSYTKGAPEIVIESCIEDFDGKVLSERKRKEILNQAKDMARRGLRTLALAYKKDAKAKDAEKNMVFIGLVGMIDPPRPEAKEAIKRCKEAGINVKIITGDHELTAIYVAREAGMKVKKVLTGKDLSSLTFEQLQEVVEDVDIFARITPEHKIKIVQALQQKEHRVLVTGDGINDAPALKLSEVGIAMGRGTEVAKEASDIILVEEDFLNIVHAIEEGRRVYENIKNSVVYLVSTSFAEVAVILFSLFSGLPFPYSAKQILWLNIVTEGIPATGFVFERGEKELMKNKPKDPKEGFLNYKTMKRIIGQAVVMSIGVFTVYYFASSNLSKAVAIAFNTMVWFELFNAINCRSEKTSLFRMKLSENKAFVGLLATSFLLQIFAITNPLFLQVFGLSKLEFKEIMLSIIIASTILILGELKKTKYKKIPI
jgi:Ca2+-transporting ATPase